MTPSVTRRWLATAAAFLMAGGYASAETAIERSLRLLAPETRLVQVCNLASMKEIAGNKKYRPDRVMVDAIGQPVLDDKKNVLAGDGGAFRSRGKWYRFSFSCRTTEDGMKVRAFTYEVGSSVPKDRWDDLGLF